MPTTPTKFRLDNVRVAFPNLFKGQQFQGEGSYRCGASLIVPPDHPQMAQINAAIEAAAVEKWKDKAPAHMKAAKAKDKIALRDGDLKPQYDGYPGNMYLSANCAGGATEAECSKPQVYDQKTILVTDPAKNPIYSGCYVNALVQFYADARFGDAVNCSLVGIQFRADGDAFGAARASADDFETQVTEGADAADFA